MIEDNIVFGFDQEIIEEPEPDITPVISIEREEETYIEFSVAPLKPGFGTTIGAPLRRILLSSLTGWAITWLKIEGIQHEYASIPNVKEEVMEFLTNIKGVRIKSNSDRSGKLRLTVKGPGIVTAGDISTSSDFEVVNADHHLMTLDSKDAKVDIEFNVEEGIGYQLATAGSTPSGTLPVDPIFNPIIKASYSIEPSRVGQATNFEKLVFQLWTDGTCTPINAIKKAAEILRDHMFIVTNIDKPAIPQNEINGDDAINISQEIYQLTVDKLELSARTLNCLKRADLETVAEIIKKEKQEYMSLRNFGVKSLNELEAKLISLGLNFLNAPIEDVSTEDVSTEDTSTEDTSKE